MDAQGYAVFFFDQALEVLGDAIKPYLQEGRGGVHVLCAEIDTGGALVEMTLAATTQDGQTVETELMVPSNMVRMIVSARSDGAFGFGRRDGKAAALPAGFPMPAGATPAMTDNTPPPGQAPATPTNPDPASAPAGAAATPSSPGTPAATGQTPPASRAADS